MSKHLYLDKDGWPVELIEGRPITNLIRILLHGRMIVRREWYERFLRKFTTNNVVFTYQGPYEEEW